jgi:hypothetical protein
MMNQYYALALVTCIATVSTIDASYASIQERQQAVIEQYNALIQKWSPALETPSDATLKIAIKQKGAALKAECSNAHSESDIKAIKSIQDSLKTLPVQFMCNELDNDIETVFKLQETARTLNMSYVLDPLPFQQLRAAIDTLPCMAEEQAACKRMGGMYKYFLAFVGGVLLVNHFSLIPVSSSSNA